MSTADLSQQRAMPLAWDHFRQEAAEYRHIGDLMQSEASRLAEWADKTWSEGGTQIEMPYEVRMAIIGLRDSIEDWTQARIGYATAAHNHA